MATVKAAEKPLIQIDDLVREMTDEELAQRTQDQAEAEARKAEAEAKAAARESALAKLADLGLTAEEIAAL
jgi:DNA-binding NarL/FixJ family response regulator